MKANREYCWYRYDKMYNYLVNDKHNIILCVLTSVRLYIWYELIILQV